MFAPKKIGSRLRARYVRSAHMFAPQKKNRLALTRSLGALRAYVFPKKSARAYALAMCAPRTCLPPHNISLPPSCPPHFLNPGAATDGNISLTSFHLQVT